ncbi:MAG: hypothetical protein AB7N80_11425 [Bdellovibrionales bacterium]
MLISRISSTLLMSLAGYAYAGDTVAPAMFTACPQAKTLRAPAGGAGVYFSADCSVAYVLPPRLGQINIARPTQTANVRVCGAVENVFSSIDVQSRKVNQLIKQIERAENDVEFSGLQDPWISAGPSVPPLDNLNPQIERLEELRDKATEATLKVLKFNEALATYEGPKVRLTVNADHDLMVREYQRLNPKVVFRPMPIAKSVLTFVGKVTNNIGRAPAALFMDLAGVRVSTDQFTGMKPEDELNSQSAMDSAILFSSAVSGQLVLSLVGACPFYDMKSGQFPDVIEAAKMTSYIAPAVDYIYNVQVNRKYEASYNLAELLKRIQKQSTRGGFFTTRTLHSLVVEQSSQGWFKFKSLSEDPRHQWDEQLAQTIKAGLVARLLQRLNAKPVAPADVPGLIAPGKNGADTASSAMKQCPHIYCQAGAYILQGLSSVFGGSDAVSEYINTQNHWEKETVEESKMVSQMGQVGFTEE